MIKTREIDVDLNKTTKLTVKTTKDIDVNKEVEKKPSGPIPKKVSVSTAGIDVVTEQEKRDKAKNRVFKARMAKGKKK